MQTYVIAMTEQQIQFVYNQLMKSQITGEQIAMFQSVVSSLQNPVGRVNPPTDESKVEEKPEEV
jgi:hypothetical protein